MRASCGCRHCNFGSRTSRQPSSGRLLCFCQEVSRSCYRNGQVLERWAKLQSSLRFWELAPSWCGRGSAASIFARSTAGLKDFEVKGWVLRRATHKRSATSHQNARTFRLPRHRDCRISELYWAGHSLRASKSSREGEPPKCASVRPVGALVLTSLPLLYVARTAPVESTGAKRGCCAAHFPYR